MNLRALALLPCLAAGAAEGNTVGCGGNSYSYAEVVDAPAPVVTKDGLLEPVPRAGPVEVIPHSLCADLIERRRERFGPLEIEVEAPLPPRPRRRP